MLETSGKNVYTYIKYFLFQLEALWWGLKEYYVSIVWRLVPSRNVPHLLRLYLSLLASSIPSIAVSNSFMHVFLHPVLPSYNWPSSPRIHNFTHKKTTIIIPVACNGQLKGTEHWVWEIPPLYSFLQKNKTQRVRGE